MLFRSPAVVKGTTVARATTSDGGTTLGGGTGAAAGDAAMLLTESPRAVILRSMNATPPAQALIGPYTCGPGHPLLLIAGPCVLENESLAMQIAERLHRITATLPVQWIFKGSFDKANRTSGSAFRGLGIEEGLRVLEKVRRELNVPVTTDIHESTQAAPVSEVCELLQIPAFLCRQTDLLVAAARTPSAIHVKKAQFLAPWDMQHVVGKLREIGRAHV